MPRKRSKSRKTEEELISGKKEEKDRDITKRWRDKKPESKKDEKDKAQAYTPEKKLSFDKLHGKEVELPPLQYWSPEKTGDTIIGLVSRKVQSKKFTGYFYILDVSQEGEDQKDVGLPSHVLLNRRLDQVQADSIVAIRFEGKPKDASSYDYSVKVIF